MKRLTRSVVVLTTALLGISACSSDSKTTSTTAASSTTSIAAATSSPSTGGSTPSTGATDSVPASVDIAVSTPPTESLNTGTASADTAAPDAGASIYSVETPSGVVTLKAKPVKIVSLAPTHTESLFAIGAGAQIIAVDNQSNFPAAATAVKTDLSGYTPNIEAIAGYKPDLVVTSDDAPDGIAAQLKALDIPVWVGPAATTLDDVYSQIQQLGVLTGHGDEASKLISGMQDKITKILADVPDSEVPITYYHELDNTYFSVTSNTFIGQLYSLANLQNIAGGAKGGNDYPQLSAEFIIKANPKLIFLADTKCCGESPATVAARDGWATITAVKTNGVIAMDDDIASRWGPRVVDYLQAIVDAVKVAASVPAG